jgi:hypothetical protein
MKDIYIYSRIEGWIDEKPDTVVKGVVKGKTDKYIEIQDENGYTQILVLDKLFAVVY